MGEFSLKNVAFQPAKCYVMPKILSYGETFCRLEKLGFVKKLPANYDISEFFNLLKCFIGRVLIPSRSGILAHHEIISFPLYSWNFETHATILLQFLQQYLISKTCYWISAEDKSWKTDLSLNCSWWFDSPDSQTHSTSKSAFCWNLYIFCVEQIDPQENQKYGQRINTSLF